MKKLWFIVYCLLSTTANAYTTREDGVRGSIWVNSGDGNWLTSAPVVGLTSGGTWVPLQLNADGTVGISAMFSGAVNQGLPGPTNSPWPVQVTNFPAGGSNVTVTNFPTVQEVSQSSTPWIFSGTVDAIQSGAWSVGRTWDLNEATDNVSVWLLDGSGNPINSTTGALDVQISNSSLPVTGTFFQSVQPISGSVSISNFPTTQPISGSVSVSNFPATQPVSGTVAVSNFPSTQPVSGTVTTLQGTSPWVVSGSTTVAGTVQANQGTPGPTSSPWPVAVQNFPMTQAVTQAGAWTVGRNWNLTAFGDSVDSWTMDGLGNSIQSTSNALNVFLTNSSLPVTGTFFQSVQPVSGTVSVGNFPSTQVVSGSVSVSNFPATQPISGTVNQGTAGTSAWPVSIASPVAVSSLPAITGTVSVSNFPVTQPVSGTVTANAGTGTFQTNITNSSIPVTGTFFQATQPVSGSVSVSNFPSTQPISGTVNQGTPGPLNSPWPVVIPSPVAVTGTFFQTTQPVSGSVSVSNFPATQPVSGTVSATQGTSPWVISGSTTVSGSVTANQGTPGPTASPWPVSVQNFPAIQAVTQSGTWTTGRTWSLLNTTDSVNSVQSGTWTTGRTWALNSSTDSVAANAAQSGTWTTGRTWNLTSASDSVAAVQSGTWNINNITGTVSLPTGAATAAKQPALGTAGTASTDVITIQGIASMTPLACSQSGTYTVQQGTPPWSVSQSGAWATGRTWTTASGTDSISSVQSGAWTTGRTWTLGSGTDSVSVVQSTSPWIVSGSGTAGTPASGVVTIQGISGGTKMPVTTSVGQSGTPTQTSVSCGLTSTTLLAAGAATKFVIIRNPTTATATVWTNVTGVAAVTALPSFDIPPGGEVDFSASENSFLPTAQYNCISGGAAASSLGLIYQ